jgi:hypothetical protein
VTGLTGFAVAVIAVQPILIGHLLWQLADDFAAGIARGGFEGVTARAQRCTADLLALLGLKPLRRAAHDALEEGW